MNQGWRVPTESGSGTGTERNGTEFRGFRGIPSDFVIPVLPAKKGAFHRNGAQPTGTHIGIPSGSLVGMPPRSGPHLTDLPGELLLKCVDGSLRICVMLASTHCGIAHTLSSAARHDSTRKNVFQK